MNYGLVFFFLILVFVFSLPTTSLNFKMVLGVILLWFVVLALPLDIAQFITELNTVRPKNTSNQEFLPIAGVNLKKELTSEYKKTIDFIQENSNMKDLIYIYPNGPYCQLTGRNSAVSIASSWYYDLAPSLVKVTLNQLEQNNPKLVIINTYNATSLKTNLNNLTYNVHSEGKDLIFEGIITPVEDYISSNYEILKKTKVAWILGRRKEYSSAKSFYLPIEKEFNWSIKTQGLSQESDFLFDNSIVFRVEKKNPLINFTPESFKGINQMLIKIKIEIGLVKTFSKYVVDVFVRTNDGEVYLVNRQLATSNWQDIWINLPYLSGGTQVTELLMSISDNQGFFWFGQPRRISLKLPRLFMLNRYLNIEDSAFKQN
jgi:hypothetical protein